MASKRKDAPKAIPHDPFEDMENSESQMPEDAEILESITEGIAVEISAADAGEVGPMGASDTEIESETRMHVEDDSFSMDEPIAPGEIVAIDDVDIEEPEKDVSPGGDGSAQEDSVSVEELGPVADRGIVSIETGFDEDQSNPIFEVSTTSIDDEIGTATETLVIADGAPEELEAPQEQHIIFTLADTEYSAQISNVMEIGYPLNVTPLPNVPGWVLGLANLRGDVISIVDLRAFLGLGKIVIGGDARLLLAKTLQGDFSVGLIVDSVRGIRYLSEDQIAETTVDISPQVNAYTSGSYDLDGRILLLLDLERLLSSTEMRQFEMG